MKKRKWVEGDWMNEPKIKRWICWEMIKVWRRKGGNGAEDEGTDDSSTRCVSQRSPKLSCPADWRTLWFCFFSVSCWGIQRVGCVYACLCMYLGVFWIWLMSMCMWSFMWLCRTLNKWPYLWYMRRNHLKIALGAWIDKKFSAMNPLPFIHSQWSPDTSPSLCELPKMSHSIG